MPTPDEIKRIVNRTTALSRFSVIPGREIPSLLKLCFKKTRPSRIITGSAKPNSNGSNPISNGRMACRA